MQAPKSDFPKAALSSCHVTGCDNKVSFALWTFGDVMARILIVDDSPSQIAILRRIVEAMGHTVVTAEDGAKGVEAAKRELPDLILMDVVMPNLNGFQATRTISREKVTSHIPVILVTTKDQETDRVWGMRQGAKGYLTKPVSEKDLQAAIHQYIGK